MALENTERAGLLSRKSYDNDAASIGSSDVDHPSLDRRTSRELAESDREVFEDDYEESIDTVPLSHREGLARIFQQSAAEPSGGQKKDNAQQKRRRISRRHKERRRRGEEESELMYEMEEGGEASLSPSRDSSELDLYQLGKIQENKRTRKRRRFTHAIIHISIIALFLIFLYAAYRATLATRHPIPLSTLSNGTTTFLPTTILISLDGFRADFLQRGLTPTLNSFIQEGISPLYMLPSFPSVTFPNHYTMVTGLYPESHGVVGNTFWDPDLQEEFYYTDPARSMQAKWWCSEPLWVTAELQGIRTAVHMWPGSEAHISSVEPSFVDKYNGKESLENKVNRVLSFVDQPEETRPQLIMAYVPVVDSDGHRYGPNSTEIRQTISNVDDMLRSIFLGLAQRNLTDIVNVVIVSDHGMATTDTSRLIQLEELINTNEIEHIDGWPLYGLRPKDTTDLNQVYTDLKVKAASYPSLEIYLRDLDMPTRYHFSANPRIAPLWIIPKAGWAIVTKDEFDVEKARKEGLVYHPRGLHGYDHEHPLMRAIFVARGPAFPHEPGSRVEVFQNTEVYNVVCDSVGIEPRPNNGTLRLPFSPVGLHLDDGAPMLETPSDPEDPAIPEQPEPVNSDDADGKGADEKWNDENKDGDDEAQSESLNWWDWLTEKLKKAKEKLSQLLHTGSSEESSSDS